jgi:hypothetical protein
MAIVLGVNVLSEHVSIPFANAGLLSPDGKCHTFDQATNGYCRGEGYGGVLLSSNAGGKNVRGALIECRNARWKEQFSH